MYPVPPPPALPGQKQEKPALVGVRNKQRKGVTKANAKFEPQAFRDQLLKHLESVPSNDFDQISTKLDALGNQLDYHKYEQQLFELLLVGGLLAPGGGFADDSAPKCAFSVLGSAQEPVTNSDMKKVVEVFNKLMRRYKYLQKPFEETALPGILQYANKFTEIEQEKLATATALFISTGLASANVLRSLKKDHLVKNGTSIKFLTSLFKVYLQNETIDHLSASLRKGGVTDLEAFFPTSKQSTSELSTHFKSAGLQPVVDFYMKQKSGQAKEDAAGRLREFIADEADFDEISDYLNSIQKRGILNETELISIAFVGLLSGLDMTAKPEMLPDMAVKEILQIAPLLEPICQKPATEVHLINTIQIWAYENTKLMPAFPKILKTLYAKDVLSSEAIIYWHSKGAKPQAKQHFLTSTAPLVNFLKEQEEESDEEEE